jgi:thymidylate synthase ThyX
MSEFPRRIYLLDPRRFSPETIAVAFAKTSRSPEPFDQIAAELNDSKSAEFHDKWVVGYGHSSVAEHAVLHLAMENISRLAIECVESNRLASFTEKSTRYQKWSADAFVIPPELAGNPKEDVFTGAAAALLEAYRQALEIVGACVRSRFPREAGESDARWDARIRLQYVDVCRYLLPAAILANVGVTVNARALEHAIRKMLSHPLAEVRQIGAEVRKVALAETPTLVKYADANEYLRRLPEAVRAASGQPALADNPLAEKPRVTLVAADPEGEWRALAAAEVRFAGRSFAEGMDRVRRANAEERTTMAQALAGGMGPHDWPPREFEHAVATFEAVMDQGAYFEVKRHRMMTQTAGSLGCGLGYVTPRLVADAGFAAAYDAAMQRAGNAWRDLAGAFGEDVAAYVVPNGYLRRLVFTLNLREAFHFCQLRTSSAAHPAVRFIAREVGAQLQHTFPLLTGCLRLEDEPAGKSFLL